MEENTEAQRLIKEIEKERNSTVIMLTMDETRSIDKCMVSQVYRMLELSSKEKKLENIDVILHSLGGDADAAYHIVKILRSYCKDKLTFIVPRLAKSAATLMVCGGDSVIMNKPSELGQLDPQIIDSFRGVRYSPLSIRQTIEFLNKIAKENMDVDGQENYVIKEAIRNLPLMEIGDNLRALNHIADYLQELLKDGMFKKEYKESPKETEKYISEIVHNLIEGHYSHSKCITYDKAKLMGLKIEDISKEQWIKFWKLFEIFEKEVLIKNE